MASKDTLVLGTRKGLLLLERQNGKWKFTHESFPGVPVSYATLDSRTNKLWACLDHGHWGQKLHCSDDMGKTWKEITAPKYPEDARIISADVAFSEEAATSEGIPAALSYMWVIQPGPDDNPDRLYIGTEPGGLFQSDDGGETFQLVEGLWNHPSRLRNWFGGGRDYAGVHSVVIDPRDSNHILVGISVGGVFETIDGGKTWCPRNKGLYADFLPDPYAEVGHDPHLLVAAPNNPDILWQQNHCGIFRSTDGAQTWENISQSDGPANFGFAIAVDENDPNIAWVVPAVSAEFRMTVDRAMSVCRTEDGGKTWTALRNGLPQENCYDYAFRHALDINGDTLVFGTVTGNLFVSDNRGDNWESIAHYLPQVYSVRFIQQ